MTSAEHNKARRDRARAAGMCQTCTKQPTADGLSTCRDCTKLKRKWNAEYAATGMYKRPRWAAGRPADRFCIDCQFHSGHRVDCKTNNERTNQCHS